MSIYLPCDIRGHASNELPPDLYRLWGIALGRQVAEGAKFIVGGDTRPSTPERLDSLIEGLSSAGVDVVNVGQLPSPLVYHAMFRLRAKGCAIVTASHNEAAMNGLKWMIGDRPPTPEDVAALRAAVESPSPPASRSRREPRLLDVTFDYVANLQEAFVDSMQAHLHVVVDPLFGVWASRARRYLQAIFPHCLFTSLHDKADPAFAGLVPDCSLHENLHDLSEAVYRAKADLGIAFDGDGDRLALVDNEGMALSPEEAAWAMLQCVDKEVRGQRVIHDVKYSDRIVEAIRETGAEPVAERSGHAFIRARMKRENAAFGLEASGHYFFRAINGDDGLYAACRVIAFLAEAGLRLSDLRCECPRVYITPELRLETPRDEHTAVIEQVCRQWSHLPQSRLDGVRIDTPGGWILARPSITEAAMKFRFESFDFSGLDDLVQRFCASLPQFGARLLEAYRHAMGVADEGYC